MSILLIALFAFCCITIIILLYFLKRFSNELVIDQQSKLKNYRWLINRVQMLIKKQKNNAIPFSIAIIDIDNFRRFNLQGIEAGDEILFEFAQRLRKKIEKIDDSVDVVRYRLGDEFALIFSNCPYSKALNHTIEILESFKQNKIITNHYPDPVQITFKFGIAEYKNGDSLNSIFKSAENDLVKNKTKNS